MKITAEVGKIEGEQNRKIKPKAKQFRHELMNSSCRNKGMIFRRYYEVKTQ